MSRRTLIFIVVAVLSVALAVMADFRLFFSGIGEADIRGGVATAFPGAVLSIGARGADNDGNTLLSDVGLSWPGGDRVSVGKAVILEESGGISIRMSNVSARNQSGLEARAEEIDVSGLASGGSLRDFSAASVVAKAPVILDPDRFAVAAKSAEASSIAGGVPASIVIDGPSMLAPGRLEVAIAAERGRVEFDAFLRGQMKNETFFSALEKSMRTASLENVDFRFGGAVRATAQDVSLDLRPVLGGSGGARRGSIVFMSAALSGFEGPADIARSISLDGRQLSVSADVERSDAGNWSMPSLRVEQPELGILGGRLSDLFDPDFSGSLDYEERTLVQRMMQAIVLFENSSVPSAEEKIAGWLCGLFGQGKNPVIAAFVANPTHIQVSWHGRPDFETLHWEIPASQR